MLAYEEKPQEIPEMCLLTEREQAILLLGLGGNDFDLFYYHISSDGTRTCFTREGDTVYDWSKEFTMMFGEDE